MQHWSHDPTCTLRKKGTKAVTGAVPFTKGTNIYHLCTNVCLLKKSGNFCLFFSESVELHEMNLFYAVKLPFVKKMLFQLLYDREWSPKDYSHRPKQG